MTSPDLNLPQLDQWVLQYLQSEGLAQVIPVLSDLANAQPRMHSAQQPIPPQLGTGPTHQQLFCR
jgi:hypothetical protein